MSISINKYLLVACFLFSLKAFAGKEIYNARLDGNQISNSNRTIAVQDDRFPLFTDIYNLKSTGSVILGINNEWLIDQDALHYSVEIEVKYRVASQYDYTTTTTLEINNTGNGLQLDRSVYTIPEDAYRIDINILSVEDKQTNTTFSNLAVINDNIFIEIQLEVERYYKFDNTIPPNITHAIPTVANELNINWNQITGTEYYQLEWMHVDDYPSNVSNINTSNVAPIKIDFKNNSTRVNIKENNYKIPILFDRGYLLFRVRAVGRDINNNIGNTLYGTWSMEDGITLQSAITNPNQNIKNSFPIANNLKHEGNKNWQYNASFAEDGKRKEVITYADGSTRSRQTVTKISSNDKAVVAETMYDHQGRPALSTLPAPVVNPVPLVNQPNAEIKYYEKFSKVSANDAYDKQHYDMDNDGCSFSPPAMITNSGAALYYSPNNAEKDKGAQAYTPDAEGYPFTVTQYTPDNTGRIRKQGGVGPTLKIGKNNSNDKSKETRYIYAKPTQTQLDRLFGSEVGYDVFYKKNAVIDPNGQISVSYLDMKGNVIATALAGSKPDSLLALDSYNDLGNGKEVNDDLLSKDASNVGKNNEIKGNSLVYNAQFLVTSPGDYKFNYTLFDKTYIDACTPGLCFDCYYDLEIFVMDECGDKIPFESNGVATEVFFAPVGSFQNNNQCEVSGTLVFNIPASSSDALTLKNLKVGVYQIVKVLTIHRPAIDKYLEQYFDYLATSTETICFKTIEEMHDDTMDINFSGCEISCAECLELVNNSNALSLFNGDENAREQARKACEEFCQEPNLCSATYQMLLADVSPNGQYAKYVNSDGDFEDKADILSIFHPNAILPHPYLATPYTVNERWKRPIEFLKHDFSIAANGQITAGTNNENYYWGDNTGEKGRYRDEYGNEAKVTLSRVNYVLDVLDINAYTPKPTIGTTIQFENDGTPYIYPEELESYIDFTAAFQPSWAKSLVAYHPEFAYNIMCLFRQDSEKHDAKILQSSIEEIKVYFGPSPSTPIALSDIDIDKLIEKDPFFNSINSNSNVKGLMQLALENYTFTPSMRMLEYFNYNSLQAILSIKLSIYDITALSTSIERFNGCGNLHCADSEEDFLYCLGTDYENNPIGTLFDINNSDAENQEIWDKYVGLYLSAKQRLVHQFQADYMLSVARRYNNCIGATQEEYVQMSIRKMLLPFIFYPYTSTPYNFLNIFYSPFFQDQICGILWYQNYANKIKRYPNPNDAAKTEIELDNSAEQNAALEQSKKQADFDQYVSTGQCPIARDLQGLIDQQLKTGRLLTDGDLKLNSSFTPLLFKELNYTSSCPPTTSYTCSPSTQFIWNQTLSIDAKQLDVVFTGSKNCNNQQQPPCALSLSLPSSLSYTFSSADLVSFSELKFVGVSNGINKFTMKANFKDPVNTMVQATVSGTISGIALADCVFPDKCEANQFASNVLILMNMLNNQDQTCVSNCSTTTCLNNNTSLSSSANYAFITDMVTVMLGNGNWTWKLESGYYRIYDNTANGNPKEIRIYFYTNNTHTNTAVDLSCRMFYGLKPDNSVASNMNANGSTEYFTFSSNISGSLAGQVNQLYGKMLIYNGANLDKAIPIGSCFKPEPSFCRNNTNQNRKDLPAFLTELAEKGAFSYNANINVNNLLSFTANLKGALGAVKQKLNLSPPTTTPYNLKWVKNTALSTSNTNVHTYVANLLVTEGTGAAAPIDTIVTSCEIRLFLDNSAGTNYTFQNITEFSNLRFLYSDEDGNYHFTVFIKDNAGNKIKIKGYSCIPIDNCEFCIPNSASSKERNIWYFGLNAGLDFSSGSPVAITDGQLNTREGCASISDKNGDLLLYTDGISIYNKNHNEMHNGDELMGDQSSTQSAIIVPDPANNNKYYVFTLDRSIYGIGSSVNNGCHYSIVDFSNPSYPYGTVINKNTLVSNKAGERITAVRHKNNKDYWIIIIDEDSPDFLIYLLSSTGLSSATVFPNIAISPIDETSRIGHLKVSPDQSIIAMVDYDYDRVEIYKFNSETGVIDNPILIRTEVDAFNTGAYGIEFSPNANYVYVSYHKKTTYIAPANVITSIIHRYDISSWDQQEIIDSRITLDSTASSLYGALQLANDGNIYVAKHNDAYLGIIYRPDSESNWSFETDGIYLEGKISQVGLPNFPYYKSDCIDPVITYGDSTNLINPCQQHLIDVALAYSDYKYNLQREALTDRFTQEYINTCLKVEEDFDVKYTDKEYHYTLYYYDQANNLIKTIPPKGVNPLDLDANLNKTKIKQDRSTGNVNTKPAHTMPTIYKYNSLNQLVNQVMPDHDTYNYFNNSLSNNGINADINLQNINVNSAGVGYAFGNDGTNNLIYTTNDGGNTWTIAAANGNEDLNGVHFTSADNAWIAGNNGTILYTNNATNIDINTNVMTPSFSKLNHNTTTENLNDIWMENSPPYQQGLAVGDNGTVVAIKNSNNVIAISGAAGSLNGIDGTSLDKSIIVGENNGIGTIYTTSENAVGNIILSRQQDVTATDGFNYVHTYSGNNTIISGYNTLLLRGNSSNTNSYWNLSKVNFPANYANSNNNIIKAHFGTSTANYNNGLVLVQDKKLFFTEDNAETWTEKLIGIVDFHFITDLEGVAISNTELFATKDGGITWVTIASNILGPQNPFGIYNTLKVTYDKALKIILVTGVSGRVQSYIRANTGDFDSPTTWSSPILPPAQFFIVAPHNNFYAYNGSFVYIGVDGKLYDCVGYLGFITPTKTIINAPPISQTNPTIDHFTGFWFKDVDNGYATTYTGQIFRLQRNANAVLTATQLGGYALPSGKYLSISGSFSGNMQQLTVTGNSGNIYTTSFSNAFNTNPTSVTWQLHNKINPLPLKAVAKHNANIAYAVGDNGRIYHTDNSGSSWKIISSPTITDNLLSVDCIDADRILVGGTNKSYYNINNQLPYTPIHYNLPQVNGVNAVGSSLHFANATGIINYTPTNIFSTSLATISPSQTDPLNDIHDNGSGTLLAVGNSGKILRSDDGDAFTNVSQNSVGYNVNHTHRISSTHAVAVGNNGLALNSENGGSTWKELYNFGTSAPDFTSCWFINPNWGFVAGNGVVKEYYFDGTNKQITDINGAASKVFSQITITQAGNIRKCHLIDNIGNYYSFDFDKPIYHYTITPPSIAAASFSPNPSIPFNSIYFVNNQTGYIAGNNGIVYKTTDGGSTWNLAASGIPSDPDDMNITDIYFVTEQQGYVIGNGGQMYKTINGGATWSVVNTGTTSTNFTSITPTTAGQLLIAGNNSTVIRIQDEVGDWSTKFWYDHLGRIVASQNSKQHSYDPPAYSYTLYDDLGRISQTGEIQPMVPIESLVYLNNKYNDLAYQLWLGLDIGLGNNTQVVKTQVVKTFYDYAQYTIPNFTQEHLRNRVSSVIYQETYTEDNNQYNYASHYSYDIHGNVKTLMQDYTELAALNQQYKRIDYDYDLISGKVNQVHYQAKQPDQFSHQYEYDADNRITHVYTSRHANLSPFGGAGGAQGVGGGQGVANGLWDQEAKYYYYDHGPLARVEIGHHKVQAIDYAYTLQGWLKGMNSSKLQPKNDMGRDGFPATNNPHQYIARDEAGFSLGYFENDYKAINQYSTTNQNGIIQADFFLADASSGSGSLTAVTKPLYNGNINHMITSIREFMKGNTTANPPIPEEAPHVKVYEYDQLNRLAYAHTYDMTTTVSSSNIWSTLNQVDKYKTNYTYDANGNIINLNRFDRNGQQIDAFNYNYPTYPTYPTNRNRLTHVNDNISTPLINDDIENQTADNYAYDKIGNLIKDEQEQIENIAWNVSGKIKSIKRYDNSNKADLEFRYDAMGHRVVKIVKPKTGSSAPYSLTNEDQWTYTYYIRDANGNIMATYQRTTIEESNNYKVDYKLQEYPIYGSSRIGVLQAKEEAPLVTLSIPNTVSYNSNGTYNLTNINTTLSQNQGNPNISYHYLGKKQYELSNHLGNVLATVSDIKTPVPDNNGTIVSYTANVQSATIYDPFGAEQRREVSPDGYRYGFNSFEKDDEIKGAGNHITFGDYGYDPRIGRRLNNDPDYAKYPSHSPYNSFMNNPILYIDPTGRGAKLSKIYGEDGKLKEMKVTSIIYVYNNTINEQERKCWAEKIQSDINNSFRKINNSDEEPYITVKGSDKKPIKIPVCFEVTVIPVTEEQAQDIANSNPKDKILDINFMRLTNDDNSSFYMGNSGAYDISQVGKNNTTGPHEFMRMMGWLEKNGGIKDGDIFINRNNIQNFKGLFPLISNFYELKDNSRNRVFTDRDFKGINFGEGIKGVEFAPKKDSNNFGERSNNQIYSSDSDAKKANNIAKDTDYKDY